MQTGRTENWQTFEYLIRFSCLILSSLFGCELLLLPTCKRRVSRFSQHLLQGFRFLSTTSEGKITEELHKTHPEDDNFMMMLRQFCFNSTFVFDFAREFIISVIIFICFVFIAANNHKGGSCCFRCYQFQITKFCSESFELNPENFSSEGNARTVCNLQEKWKKFALPSLMYLLNLYSKMYFYFLCPFTEFLQRFFFKFHGFTKLLVLPLINSPTSNVV